MSEPIIAEVSEEVKLELEYIFGDPLPPDECGCVLPEQYCPVCEAIAAVVCGDDDGELSF